MSESSRELRALRTMAWERAKGELYGMMHTYYTESDGDKFLEFDKAFKIFKTEVEDNGLQE